MHHSLNLVEETHSHNRLSHLVRLLSDALLGKSAHHRVQECELVRVYDIQVEILQHLGAESGHAQVLDYFIGEVR